MKNSTRSLLAARGYTLILGVARFAATAATPTIMRCSPGWTGAFPRECSSRDRTLGRSLSTLPAKYSLGMGQAVTFPLRSPKVVYSWTGLCRCLIARIAWCSYTFGTFLDRRLEPWGTFLAGGRCRVSPRCNPAIHSPSHKVETGTETVSQ